MPTISMFFGIIIRMHYAPKEHPPSHFMYIMVSIEQQLIF